MSLSVIKSSPDTLIGQRLAGLTIRRLIDEDAVSAWFEATEDVGTQRLLYFYDDAQARARNIPRVYNFHTTVDQTLLIAGEAMPVFCSMGDYRIMLDRHVRQSLTDEATMPKSIEDFEVISLLGFGKKGVTYRVKRSTGPATNYALKITISEDYTGKSYVPEVDRMVELSAEDREHFPQVHACGEESINISGKPYSFIYMVQDFIAGNTLEDLFTLKPELLTVTFLETFTRHMLAALGTMQRCKLMHDDLHTGNVMILTSSTGGIRPCLIDFGSTKPIAPTKKVRDDLRNLASMIANIHNRITHQSEARTKAEECILGACEGLLATMSEDDPLRRPDKADDLLRQFEEYFPRNTVRQTLKHPFDFGNAEEMSDNVLLHQLAAKSFPWRDKIESSSNTLVIGPRGCGKTTVFRSMSFLCLAEADHIEDGLSRNYIGLYISCTKDFRTRFSALDRDLIKRRENEIRHYFNLLVLREFAGTLIVCEGSHKLSIRDVKRFQTFLEDVAGMTFSDAIMAAGSTVALQEMESAIIKGIDQARRNIWNDKDFAFLTNQGLISDLATLARQEIGPFVGKVIYLLVDDYTERKVPKEAQQALNHILFVPNSVYKSKISSEVFGVPPDQTFGSFLDQDRDYKEWNLGTLYYLGLPSREQKAFLQEIVNNRLRLCAYQGAIEDIIGSSDYGDGNLAQALKREAEARNLLREQRRQTTPTDALDGEVDEVVRNTNQKAYYHGWDTICDLCTGDVSNILEVLGRMYDQCKITKTQRAKVEPKHQHAVITRYSTEYITKIKGIPEYGEKLFQIVDAFGNMSHRLLQEHSWLDLGDGREDPYKLLRIELDEAYVQAVQDTIDQADVLSKGNESSATFLWRLLQRHAIFIDAHEGRSRRNTLSSRVVLRRIFCPAFNIALASRESYTVSKAQWEAFCFDPSGTADRYVKESLAKDRKQKDSSTNVALQHSLPLGDE